MQTSVSFKTERGVSLIFGVVIATAVLPQKRRFMLAGLALATAVGAAGLAAGGTAGALIATELTGTDTAAGLPLGLVVVGSAGGALLISRLSARLGRGRGLACGYAVGVAGSAVVVLAVAQRQFGLFLLGNLLYGAANAAIFLTRYAAADIGAGIGRGRALGLVLFATSLGAVASPSLLTPSGHVAVALGLPRLGGMYLLAGAVFAFAALVSLASSALRDGATAPLSLPIGEGVTRGQIVAALREGPARRAVAVLAVTNLLMVSVMAVAPVRLMEHGHGLTLIGAIISVHVAGMFAPSPISGWLADRFGAAVVAFAGIGLLVVVGGYGSAVAEGAALPMAGVLLMLGVAWNLGIVGGSALLIGAVPAAVRPHVEGIGEVAMGLAAAVGAPLAGILVATAGLAAVWIAIVLVAAAMIASRYSPKPAPA